MQTLQSTGKWATFGAEWRQREKKSTEKSQEWSLTRIPREGHLPPAGADNVLNYHTWQCIAALSNHKTEEHFFPQPTS